MGLIDKIRGFVSGSNNTPAVQEDKYAKTQLAMQIINLAGKINRINCFSQDVSRLANMSNYELEKKSMEELTQIYNSLNSRYNGLVQQREINNRKSEAAIAAKWTGQRTPEMTSHDLDFTQGRD